MFLQRTLGEALSRKAAAKRHEAFLLLTNHLPLRAAAGWAFEHAAHIIISNPNRPPLQTYIRGVARSPIPPANNMITGSTALSTIQPPFDFYWQPGEPNFPGVDALIRLGADVWYYSTLYPQGMVLQPRA